MTYVLDTSFVVQLHKHYYRENFVSLWKNFDALVANGRFTSTREVLRELDEQDDAASKWAAAHADLFPAPNAAEGAFVAGIYKVPHFQQNIEQRKLLKGGKNADPFVIARAASLGAIVVTMEQLKPKAAKIPNICEHFKVGCFDLRKFMEVEKWKF